MCAVASTTRAPHDIYELLLSNRDRAADAIRQVALTTPGRTCLQTTDLDVMAEGDGPPAISPPRPFSRPRAAGAGVAALVF